MILTVRESLRRLYHRLIRLKLLSEHSFGQLSLIDRLLHVRLLSALLLSAPALLFMLWYSGLAVSTHLRQKSAVTAEEPLTAELFQLHLHDRLVADARRLTMGEPTVRSELPTYNMVISNDKLTQLDANLPPDEGRAAYVSGFLQHKNQVHEIDVRYRGTKHWHWNNPQKSWKIRVKPDHLMFEGLPTFNFVNTPDPMPFNEQMVLDVARDAGLLTPAYYPFRLQLNRAFLGVYFFEAQPDEGLLRRARRVSGSIYSGSGAPTNPETQVSSLWESAKHWKKVGASAENARDVSELEGLLTAVNRSTARGFAEFAETTLDIEKFVTFDAIDVVFGNNQHDYHQNHKLYFDPYKNRFEPIATDFRDMEQVREFNRTEHPLLLRLKQLPDYLSRRNRRVYELITGPCSANAIAELTRHWTELLTPDQSRDPYWDAYELLPVMGTYYRQLVRPMTAERQALAARMRLHDHGLRVEYLRGELSQLEVAATLYVPPADSVAGARTRKRPSVSNEVLAVVDVTVGGPAAFELGEVSAEFPAGCTPREWQLFADRDLDRKFSVEHDLRLLAVAPPLHSGKADLTLYPGVSLRSIPANEFRGRVRAQVESRDYRFFFRSSGCAPQRIVLVGRNTATLGPVSLATRQLDSAPVSEAMSCDDSAGFSEPGSKTLHPFCYPLQVDETLHLGPGTVELKKTRIYSRYQTLVIEPGTTIQASGKGTLIAYGKVIAEGRPDAKIRFEAREGHWGGLALQGPGTAGSRFSHVEFTAGTKPADRSFFNFPGMVNLHDTRDIQFSFVSFSNNEESDDALHVAYVDGLVLGDVTFSNVPIDAIDIAYSVAKLNRVTVAGVGGDGLELMGSRVELVDSKFIKCQENALSIGERSEVTATRILLARGPRAVWLKNTSSLTVSESLVYGNALGVRLEGESLWYSGLSKLRMDEVHSVQTAKKIDGSAATLTGQFIEGLSEKDLAGLRRDVAEIPEWSALDLALDRLEQRRAP